MSGTQLAREQALSIWHAGVDAVRPRVLFESLLQKNESLRSAVEGAERILVVGAGKAGAAMSEALESVLVRSFEKIVGIVNVPDDAARPLEKIQLHAARAAGSNHPTAEGVIGADQMLELVSHASRNDIAICLLSGGGSALLPAPVAGVSLADKQHVTKLLHACGATIQEMNTVRKHLSRIKGGRLAQSFSGQRLFSLIISDVVGDPLDVIASGPTVADPSTFHDAILIFEKYGLDARVPPNVLDYLRRGARGEVAETCKQLPASVENIVLGNNFVALKAARKKAESLGYRVLCLGAFIEGETAQAAIVIAGIVRSIRKDNEPCSSPCCILVGGETTVTLGEQSGKGGRNQEFVLAMLAHLGVEGMKGISVLSAGTDGEDGPTDAAGALADAETLSKIRQSGLSIEQSIAHHDAYPILAKCDGLLRTGLTHTNVMDLRVILIA